MTGNNLDRKFAYWLIAIGAVISFISGVVPQPAMAYELWLTVMIVGFTPYIVYGFAVPHLRGMILTLPGIALVVIHGWLVIDQRFTGYAGYEGGLIYAVPLGLSVLMAGLLVWAMLNQDPMGRPWHRLHD